MELVLEIKGSNLCSSLKSVKFNNIIWIIVTEIFKISTDKFKK